MAEGCQAERMLMSARFHEGQIRMIEIALRVYRANIDVTDKQPIWRAQWHQVATEIDQRIRLGALSPALRWMTAVPATARGLHQVT